MHLDNVGAVILAGGRATRMGGEDKGLVCLKGKPLVCRAAEKLMPVCAHVVVSANRNLAAYRALGLTVVTDSLENFPGPLAGWLSAMDALTTDYVVSIPCDVPFFPADMVEKLYAALVARPDKACACGGISATHGCDDAANGPQFARSVPCKGGAPRAGVA